MKAWKEAALLIGLCAIALGLSYAKGKEAGEIKATKIYAQMIAEARAKTDRAEATIDAMASAALEADQARENTHREIIRETSQIIDRPVYRDQCIDGDGLHIIDRLAANANGENTAPSVGAAAAPAKGTTDR